MSGRGVGRLRRSPYSPESPESIGPPSLFSRVLSCATERRRADTRHAHGKPHADRAKAADARAQAARTQRTETGVTIIGAPQTTLRDFYYLFLKVRWSGAIAVIVVVYLALNALFAVAYLVLGGVTNAHAGSFYDAFCFSVETMGTIGYGSMYPASVAANAIMIVESVTSLVITALATGLIFAKFSRSSARIAFSKHLVIGPMDGMPTLMLRVGNERGNQILEATIRLAMVRTELTKENRSSTGCTICASSASARRRCHARGRCSTPSTTRAPSSARRRRRSCVTRSRSSRTSWAPTTRRSSRFTRASGTTIDEIIWGARHADILTEDAEGNIVMDVRRFHDIQATPPFEGFPYSADAAASAPAPAAASAPARTRE